MSLFDRIIMWRYRSEAITLREVKVLLRTMRLYSHAYREGGSLPDLPRVMTKQLRTMWIWAAFRVSVEQPAHFALGVLLSIPSIGFLLYQFVMFVVQLIEPKLAGFAGN